MTHIVKRNAHDMGDVVMSALSGQYLESFAIEYGPGENATIVAKCEDGSVFVIRVSEFGKGQASV